MRYGKGHPSKGNSMGTSRVPDTGELIQMTDECLEMRPQIGRHDAEEPVFQPRNVILILKVMGNNLLFVFAPFRP